MEAMKIIRRIVKKYAEDPSDIVYLEAEAYRILRSDHAPEVKARLIATILEMELPQVSREELEEVKRVILGAR